MLKLLLLPVILRKQGRIAIYDLRLKVQVDKEARLQELTKKIKGIT